MMTSFVLHPHQRLWIPRRRLVLAPAAMPHGLPQSPDGKFWASGDTLATFLPLANQPPASNYAALVNRNGQWLLAFDTTTQQIAIFAGKMPRTYGGGGLTVYVSWAAASATSGTIGWDVTFERRSAGNHDLDADAWATAQTITAATVDGTAGKETVTSVAITAGSTGTDAIAAGDGFRLRIRRDVANDTAAGDAHLVDIEIKET